MDPEPNRAKQSPRDGENSAGTILPAQRAESSPPRKSVLAGTEMPAGEAIARLATAQKGPISRRQLQAAGLSSSGVGRRAGSGQLHRVYRGVYLVGHQALAPLARESAALLACGEGAILSHESAAVAWAMLTDYTGDVHITMVGRQLHSRAGLRLHRASSTPPTRRRHGLTVTSPPHTLLDLAASKSPHLEHAFIEGHGLRLIRADDLARAIERAGPRPGVRALRALIAANESGFTRSKAERILRRLLRAAHIPEPLFNRPLLGYQPDCHWPDHRLVLEFDGHGFHGHRKAFEADRRRDATFVAHGYRVMRVTWLQLTREPYVVVANIAAALASRHPH